MAGQPQWQGAPRWFSQTNPRSPDNRHEQHRQEILWIQGWLNPPWVKEQLAVSMIQGQGQSGKYAKMVKGDEEKLWKGFFPDPSQRWENQVKKICQRGPDFKHNSTNKPLRIDSYKKPAWVDGQLELAPAQLIVSGTSTMTSASERGPREGVHKIFSGTFGHVRTLCEAGQLKEALHILNQGGISADSDTYVCLLRNCIKMKGLAAGKQVHAHIIQNGFKPNMFLYNTLVNMYVKCGSISDAHRAFKKMSERNMFSWNTMIAGYTEHGCGRNALETYEQMIQEGMKPDQVTFICVLKVCASLGALRKGKEVHAHIIKAGFVPNMILNTTLMDMYAKCGSIEDAKAVFYSMAERSVVSWNVMIAGYARHGCGMAALETYEQMIQDEVEPDQITFVCVLKACASLADLEKGKVVHADILKAGIVPNIILDTTLVDMYAKCGSIKDAKEVFDHMTDRNVVSWNAMIAGYAQHGCGMEAFEMYEQMVRDMVKPDQVTFVCICNACGSLATLEKGNEVHADIMKAGIVPNIFLENALVDMYAKCGSIEDAKGVFDNMAEQNVVSWSAMIAGYAQNGSNIKALEMYEQMKQEGVTPNQVTFVCVLKACASLAVLEKGKEVHADIMKAGIVPNIFLANTLLDMYATSGSIEDAKGVFDNMAERNVVSWNAMMTGYAQHGCHREALQLFERMEKEGLKPDSITFICVLSACSHVGLVDEGRHYFDYLCQDHDLTPTVEHFGCMVDLLCRAGWLVEAEYFMNKMPIKPDAAMWMALLAACRMHGKVDIAERAAKCLL